MVCLYTSIVAFTIMFPVTKYSGWKFSAWEWGDKESIDVCVDTILSKSTHVLSVHLHVVCVCVSKLYHMSSAHFTNHITA